MNHCLKLKLISVIALLCFMFAFGISAYEISYEKGRISDKEFTVSESLAYGDEQSLVTLFTLGMIAYIYLLTLRGPKKLLYIRIFALIIVYIFLITIIWITTYKDQEKHYIFAFIIFLTTFIYHVLTYIAFSSTKSSNLMCKCLLVACILNGLVFIGLGITRIKSLEEKNEARITFSSLENTCTLITLSVIVMIGFMC